MTGAAYQPGETLQTVELRISARPENLSLARLALVGVAETAGASDDLVADLKVAVTEACTNAIQHAYRGTEDDAEIVDSLHDWSRSLEDRSRGLRSGFEPGNPVDGSSRNGQSAHLGLMIIAALTDELSITPAPPGARISFLKRLSPGG